MKYLLMILSLMSRFFIKFPKIRPLKHEKHVLVSVEYFKFADERIGEKR